MARAIWSGSLSFGLVNVPVALISGARDMGVHFNELDKRSKARIEVRRVCSKENKEVPWEEIAHGYEGDSGDMVMVTDAELEALEPRRTRTIDIEAFVDGSEIDPIYYDHPYWVVPTGGGEGALRAYRLLAKVMEDTEQVAIGRFVLRTKEHLVALRVRDGAIALSTMLFADEVRPAADVPLPGKRDTATKTQIDRAVELIDALTTEFDPDSYADTHRKKLQQLIAKKRKGGEIEAPEKPETPAAAPDLMEALKAALEDVKGSGKRKSAANGRVKAGSR